MMDFIDVILLLLFFGWLFAIYATLSAVDRAVQDLTRDLHALSADIARVQRSIAQLDDKAKKHFYVVGGKNE